MRMGMGEYSGDEVGMDTKYFTVSSSSTDDRKTTMQSPVNRRDYIFSSEHHPLRDIQ